MDVPIVMPTETAGCVAGQAPVAVKNAMKKRYNFNAGDVIDLAVPEGAFEDCETGGTRCVLFGYLYFL